VASGKDKRNKLDSGGRKSNFAYLCENIRPNYKINCPSQQKTSNIHSETFYFLNYYRVADTD
jgi:uncharacterized protein YjaG (DUF416 family)